MSDTIRVALTDVRMTARVGVFEQERCVGNEFCVNLWVDVAVTEGMRRDEIGGTVSYADLYTVIKEILSAEALTLEYVALCIAERVKKSFPSVIRGEISVAKLAPPIGGMDGVAQITYAF